MLTTTTQTLFDTANHGQFWPSERGDPWLLPISVATHGQPQELYEDQGFASCRWHLTLDSSPAAQQAAATKSFGSSSYKGPGPDFFGGGVGLVWGLPFVWGL